MNLKRSIGTTDQPELRPAVGFLSVFSLRKTRERVTRQPFMSLHCVREKTRVYPPAAVPVSVRCARKAH